MWVVTGDGDALSIGGNHLIHALRRNVNLKILLFNNRIYGLTKGQYSPTSEVGKITKSTPMGSLDAPFNPVSLAIGAEASFVARTVDSDRKHLTEVLRQAAAHPGTALIEIYQNCNIFNDGAFEALKDKQQAEEAVIRLEHGKPIRFGADLRKGVVRDAATGDLKVVTVTPANEARGPGPRRALRVPDHRLRAVPPGRPGHPPPHADRGLAVGGPAGLRHADGGPAGRGDRAERQGGSGGAAGGRGHLDGRRLTET